MSKYKINKGFIIQKTHGGTTIFDSEESKLLIFNEPASYIFKKIKSGLNKEKIIKGMIKRYKIEEKEAEKDFADFLQILIKKMILQV